MAGLGLFRRFLSYRLLLVTVLVIGIVSLVVRVIDSVETGALAKDIASHGNSGTVTSQVSSVSCPLSQPPTTWKYYPNGGATWSTGVYDPSRLRPNSSGCVQATGKIIYKEYEYRGDGDLDYYMHVDDPALAGKSGYAKKISNYHKAECYSGTTPVCNMIWEAMPRDGKSTASAPTTPHLRELNVGDTITITGKWVYDSLHGYNEFHPIFVISQVNGSSINDQSGPQYGGSDPATNAFNTYATCLDEQNNHCVGYYDPFS
jgi:hypothetical protein